MKRHVIPFSLILACSTSPALCADAFDVAAWAPADAVAVVAWSGSRDAAAGFQAAQLGKLWKEAPVQKFLTRPFLTGWSMLRTELVGEIGEKRTVAIESVLAQLWREPAMMCVMPVESSDDWPITLGAAFVWGDSQEKRGDVPLLVEWLVEQSELSSVEKEIGGVEFSQIEDGVPVYFGRCGRRWVLAVSDGAAEFFAKAETDRPSFRDNAVHRRARAEIGDLSPFYYACFDTARLREGLIDIIVSAVNPTGAAPPSIVLPEKASIQNTFALNSNNDSRVSARRSRAFSTLRRVDEPVLGFAAAGLCFVPYVLCSDYGSQEVAAAWGFDGVHLHSAGYARADARLPLLFDYPARRKIDPRRIADVPDDAIGFEITGFDIATAYIDTLKTATSLLKDLVARKAIETDEPPRDLRKLIRDQIGWDVADDLLAHFGDQWITYTPPEMLGTVVSVDVRNAEALGKQMDKLMKLIPEELKPRKRRVGPDTMWELSVPEIAAGLTLPYRPCWCLMKDRLVISLNPQPARRFIEHQQQSGERKSAAQFAEVKAFLAGSTPTGELTTLRFRDEAEHFTQVYDQISLAYPLLIAALDDEVPELKFAPLPPAGAFTKHMARTVSWTTTRDGARVWHQKTGIPSMMLGVNPAIMAMMGGMALPALSAAREQSKTVVCASNLRAIGQACYMYALNHGDRFPPDFQALVKDENVTAAHFRCPSADVPEGDLNACYVYVAGQSTSDDPTGVLIYEKKRCHGDEGGNVLFVDGHVEFIKPYSRIKGLVDATKERIAKKKPKKDE